MGSSKKQAKLLSSQISDQDESVKENIKVINNYNDIQKNSSIRISSLGSKNKNSSISSKTHLKSRNGLKQKTISINENSLRDTGIYEYIKRIKNDAFVKMVIEQQKMNNKKSRNSRN